MRSIKKVFLKIAQNLQENICVRVSISKKLQASTETYNFIGIETPAQLIFGEFCEMFKNMFFTEHLWTTDESRN